MDLTTFWAELQASFGDASSNLAALAVNAVQAVVVALLAVLIGRLFKTRVRHGLLRARLDPNVVAIAGTAAVLGTYVAAGAIILSLLGSSWTAVVAFLGAATVAISLALQDVLRSVVAGIYLLVERPFALGDRVKVGDAEGRVEAIEFRTTVLATDGGDRVLVPNSTVFAAVVTNRSAAPGLPIQVTLTGVQAPADEVASRVSEVLSAVRDMLLAAPAVELRAASADGLTVVVRARRPSSSDPVRLVERLHAAFPAATVTLDDEP